MGRGVHDSFFSIPHSLLRIISIISEFNQTKESSQHSIKKTSAYCVPSIVEATTSTTKTHMINFQTAGNLQFS